MDLKKLYMRGPGWLVVTEGREGHGIVTLLLSRVSSLGE